MCRFQVQAAWSQSVFKSYLEMLTVLGQAAIYVAGFPCKAFSRLRTASMWLDDPQAQQFYGVVENIRVSGPIVLWLHWVFQFESACSILSLTLNWDRGPGECHGPVIRDGRHWGAPWEGVGRIRLDANCFVSATWYDIKVCDGGAWNEYNPIQSHESMTHAAVSLWLRWWFVSLKLDSL